MVDESRYNMISLVLKKTIVDRISGVLVDRTSITANQVTLISLVYVLLGSLFLALGEQKWLILGSLSVFGYIVFDLVDGNIARARGVKGKFGKWFDGICGFIALPLMALALMMSINTSTGFILGSLTMVSFPMYDNIMRFYKLDIASSNKTFITGSSLIDVGKRLYGAPLFVTILIGCTVLNMPIIVLWLFALGGNAVWILAVCLQYKKLSK